MKIIIDVNETVTMPENTQTLFEDIAKSVAKREGWDISENGPEVSVVLTDDEEIREFNNNYRQIDSPTDVLSFPMFDGDDLTKEVKDDCILGDIVISIPTMERQAESYGHSQKRELAFLFTHGMLHLSGYDHIDDEEREEMEKIQEEILSELGILR